MRRNVLSLSPSLLPRVFLRRRTYAAIRRGALGQPFGKFERGGKGEKAGSSRDRDGFQLNYFNFDGPQWVMGQQYPVDAVEPRQVVMLKALNRHLTPEDFARTVPRNIRGPLRGMSLCVLCWSGR
jgi:hypothetical protein